MKLPLLMVSLALGGGAQAREAPLAFVLTPNDLGILDFRDVTVEAAQGGLIVHRGEDRLRYERAAD